MAKTGEATKIRKGFYTVGAAAPTQAVTDEGGGANELRLDADLAA